MLLNAPYPADIRVKKESDALIAAGFDVSLLCLRRRAQANYEFFDGIHVHRIDAGKTNYGLAFWDVLMSISFIHPKFKRAITAICQKEQINFIHIHDLPLAGTALRLRTKFGFKVVVDFHENYPEALNTWFKWKRNPVVRLKNYLFMNPKKWTQHERSAGTRADKVIAVVEEMKERLVDEYKIGADKIAVVTNTEDKHFLDQEQKDVYSNLRPGFIITYSGGIGPHRGVDTAIRGMELLKQLPIHLVIVGFGSKAVMKNLHSLVEKLGLLNVHFEGYQPFSKFYSYMHFADANVIPHHSNGHTDNTVPHKLFQGMMAGKPLIVSTCAPLKRIVEQYQCGVIFEAEDHHDFARVVRDLYNSKLQQELFGKNGYLATVDGNLNWESTQKQLIRLYDELT